MNNKDSRRREEQNKGETSKEITLKKKNFSKIKEICIFMIIVSILTDFLV